MTPPADQKQSTNELPSYDELLARVAQLEKELALARQNRDANDGAESMHRQVYRAIGESIDYGIWICAPDGRNTYASASFLKLVGQTQEQCSSFGWGDVLHPDDAERTIAAWRNARVRAAPGTSSTAIGVSTDSGTQSLLAECRYETNEES